MMKIKEGPNFDPLLVGHGGVCVPSKGGHDDDYGDMG